MCSTAAAIAQSGIIDDADYFAFHTLVFARIQAIVIVNPRNFLHYKIIRYKGKPAHAGAAPHLGRNFISCRAYSHSTSWYCTPW